MALKKPRRTEIMLICVDGLTILTSYMKIYCSDAIPFSIPKQTTQHKFLKERTKELTSIDKFKKTYTQRIRETWVSII